jgi:hypothetical protein
MKAPPMREEICAYGNSARSLAALSTCRSPEPPAFAIDRVTAYELRCDAGTGRGTDDDRYDHEQCAWREELCDHCEIGRQSERDENHHEEAFHAPVGYAFDRGSNFG